MNYIIDKLEKLKKEIEDEIIINLRDSINQYELEIVRLKENILLCTEDLFAQRKALEEIDIAIAVLKEKEYE